MEAFFSSKVIRPGVEKEALEYTFVEMILVIKVVNKTLSSRDVTVKFNYLKSNQLRGGLGAAVDVPSEMCLDIIKLEEVWLPCL